jgi:Tfp pilus assembly protein PilX
MKRAPQAGIRRTRATMHAQQGVVLFIALIVLVAMTLAGLAMFRSVGTGVVIAGNLTFKQAASAAADRGIEAGRAWLIGQTAGALQADAAPGYYANWQLGFDPTTITWNDTNSLQVVSDDGAGNEIRYMIHRLCQASGLTVNAPGQQCVTIGTAGSGGSKGGGSYGVLPLSNTIQPYFRVTVRVAGPKNTVSYVQSVMY